jgi:hypothetical protein
MGSGTASTGAGRVEGTSAGSPRLRSEGPQGVHRAAGGGQKLDVPLTDATARMELKIAFITDPHGTYIELTEGLNAK